MRRDRRLEGSVRRLGERLDDRRERAEQRSTILASGLLDVDWVGRQLGRSLGSEREAADALLDADERGGPVSPHPLVEPGWAWPGQPWHRQGDNSLIWFLRGRHRRERQSPHPLVDVAAIARESPAALHHPGGPLGHWLQGAGPSSPVPGPQGMPTVTLEQVTAAARQALADHQAVASLDAALPAAERPSTGPAGTAEDAEDPADGPLVSVLLVARDDATRLHQCVRDLQRQSTGSWELVVVDAGSTDDSHAVLAGITRFEPRVVPVHAGPVGDAAARNAGLASARGRYVAFLDVDRPWHRDFLRTLTLRLQAHGGVAVVARHPDDGYRFGGTRERLLAGPYVDPALLLLRRDRVAELGGFDERLGDASTHDLVLRIVADGELPLAELPATARADPRATGAGDWRGALLDKHLVDWAELSPEAPGHTGIVLQVGSEPAHTIRWIQDFLAASDDRTELVVVGGRPTRTQQVVVGTLAAVSPRVTCRFVGSELGLGAAYNLGATLVRGERVVLTRVEVRPDIPALLTLADEACRPGVAVAQPLVVGIDDVVVSAGASFAAGTKRPEPLLRGHSVRDAGSGTPLEVAAPLSPVVALRRETLSRLGGVDASFGSGLPEVELGLRAQAAGAGSCVLVPSVVATCPARRVVDDRRLLETITLLEGADTAGRTAPPAGEAVWRSLGFEVVGVDTTPLRDVADDEDPLVVDPVYLPTVRVRPSPPLAERVAQDPPRLRWTIDTAVPAGPGRSSWGDWHFARQLGQALERLGQHVAVDPREARLRPSRDHDDVVLTLRGLDRVPHRPGPVRMAWVISHPDLVDAEELATYDRAYAASTSWAAAVTREFGVPVTPLLQCTDPSLFHPDRAAGDDGPVLFVGNSRGVFRRSLRAALAAGAEVEIHGKGWREFLGPGVVTSGLIDNDDLGAAYAGASVVLNDHWEDMRDKGFLSNRLFDAAACGARVVSDEIDGVREVFGPLVCTFADEHDMAGILGDLDASFGTRAERLDHAARIRSEHSFDRRAAILLEDAADLVRRRLG
jgi:GT2 family glycosyltransferase